MTHISKVRVDPNTYKRIRSNFRSAVSGKHNGGPDILDALLTRAERVMLSKRLAIILLLEKDISFYRISRLLKVGMPTVLRIDRHRRQGKYFAIQKAMQKKNGLSFLERTELILAMGMPSIAGPRDTARLNRLRAKRA